MSEWNTIIQEVRNTSREIGFIRGIELAAALARRSGHVALSQQLLQLAFSDGLVHLDRDERIAAAETIQCAPTL